MESARSARTHKRAAIVKLHELEEVLVYSSSIWEDDSLPDEERAIATQQWYRALNSMEHYRTEWDDANRFLEGKPPFQPRLPQYGYHE